MSIIGEVGMRWRWLASLGMALMLGVLGQGRAAPPGAGVQAGYLVQPIDDPHGFHLNVVPYLPQPGDILLFDDENPLHRFLLGLRGAGPPVHVAIAFAWEDGRPALLDLTGPTVQSATVSLVEIMPRLQNYHGVIVVRHPRQPLTPTQAADLRAFAVSQQGKEFALGRMLLQGTLFNSRNGLRHRLFAGTCMDRSRWLCSELVVAAATAAHVLDARQFPANSIYPGDLAYDTRYDLSAIYEPPVLWVPDAHPLMQNNAVDLFLN